MVRSIFFLIVFVLLLGAGYKFAVDNNLVAAQNLPEPIASALTRFSLESPSAVEQTQQLSTRAQDVTGQVQQVLGTAIEAAPVDQDPPLHERALEYGRYLYCKQVVDQYEAAAK